MGWGGVDGKGGLREQQQPDGGVRGGGGGGLDGKGGLRERGALMSRGLWLGSRFRLQQPRGGVGCGVGVGGGVWVCGVWDGGRGWGVGVWGVGWGWGG